MPKTFNTALNVVTPYGFSKSSMLSAEDRTALIQQDKEEHRTIQEILAEQMNTRERQKYERHHSLKKALNTEKSIRNFCQDIAYELHLKPITNRKAMLESVKMKNETVQSLPPQNSYIDDPKYKSKAPVTRNPKPSRYMESLSKNVKSRDLSLVAPPKTLSCMAYELNKVCKTISHMPNPVSRQLYDEMKSRRIKSAELIELRDMPCYQLHIEHQEPPCMTYFSPKPSQLYLHQRQDTLEREVKASVISNSAVQAPFSTVEVFLQFASKYTFEDFLTELTKYGPIESIMPQSKRSYRVVYSDLTGACNAITGLKFNKDLYCNWHHRHLDQRKFIRRRKGPLKVVVPRFRP